jgi:hypothetical protein
MFGISPDVVSEPYDDPKDEEETIFSKYVEDNNINGAFCFTDRIPYFDRSLSPKGLDDF